MRGTTNETTTMTKTNRITEHTTRIDRRTVLQALGGTGAVGLAGCLGRGEANGDDTNKDDDSIDTSDDTPSDGTDTDDDTETDTDETEAGHVPVPEPISYVFEYERHREDSEGKVVERAVTGQVNETGEFYEQIRVSSEDEHLDEERAYVDGILYHTHPFMDGCDATDNPDANYTPEIHQEDLLGGIQGEEPEDVTTIDGQEVYVFDPRRNRDNTTLMLYVSTETGHLLRMEQVSESDSGEETMESTTELHSFGEGFTIEPPEECETEDGDD